METIPYDHWFAPDDLIDLTNRVGDELGTTCNIRTQRGKPYREAFIAARFAAHRGAEKVRLIGETAHQTPDFAILLDDRELCFENTEADDPTRHRNQDYEAACRLFLSRIDYAAHGNRPVNPLVYAAEIHRLVQKKMAKHYPQCDGLILISHASWIDGLAPPPREWWEAACQGAQDHFPEVWIYHEAQFLRLFTD